MILTLDFEASCLPRHGPSFPIEVAVVGSGVAKSWLIKPHESWHGWHWSAQAERLHGLSLHQVEQDGHPVDLVMRELMDTVGQSRVIADSPIDQYWLDTLATASGMKPHFSIHHVSHVFGEAGVDDDRVSAAIQHANLTKPQRHRAIADAQWLFAVVAHAIPIF